MHKEWEAIEDKDNYFLVNKLVVKVLEAVDKIALKNPKAFVKVSFLDVTAIKPKKIRNLIDKTILINKITPSSKC